MLHLQPPGARLIPGDLNVDLDTSSAWLRGARSAGGCWTGWTGLPIPLESPHQRGPWAAEIGVLRPDQPHPSGPRPLLCCGAVYRGPHPIPIILLTSDPPSVLADLEVLRLRHDLTLLYAPGRLPVGLRRLLDGLFPPPDQYQLPDLWAPVVDPGELPEPPTPLLDSSSENGSADEDSDSSGAAD